MRRKFYLLLLLCNLASVYCLAQTGELSKRGMKNYKNTCKQLKKEAWRVYDNDLSLDDAIMKYYLQLEAGADSVLEMMYNGQARDVNKAYSIAKHRASMGQAFRKSLYLKNNTSMLEYASSGKSGENKSEIHISNFAHTTANVKSLTPSLCLYRTLDDGTTEINLYYIIKY